MKVLKKDINIFDSLECGQIFRFTYDNSEYVIVIKDRVISLKEDGDYIIVEQHPNREKEEATYEREYIYPSGRDTTYYWVICKKEHAFWGPLLQSELDSVLVEYSIKL